MKISDFYSLLSPLNVEILEDGDSLIINKIGSNYEWDKWTANKSELETICDIINDKTFTGISLYDDNDYEIMLDIPSSIKYTIQSKQGFKVSDRINKLEYEVSKASVYFIFSLLHKLDKSNLLDKTKILNQLKQRFSSNIQHFFVGAFDEAEQLFIDVINDYSDIYTLKIKSNRKYEPRFFQQIGSSFLFNACYTLDEPIVEIKTLDEFLHNQKDKETYDFDAVSAPNLLYNQELIYYYQMGISAETPALKYLSYYQILEYFYNNVFDEFLVNKLKTEMTRPDFSYVEDSNIKKLIGIIEKNTKLKKSNDDYLNEQKALNLLLEKYIESERVNEFVKKSNPEIISYYQKNKVPFSDGSKIDFENMNTFYQNLASRIYKTRNSIVHNKDGEEWRYIPYEHSTLLLKELHLLKFACQEIIIGTATLLNAQKTE
jgi:hypothetical protein